MFQDVAGTDRCASSDGGPIPVQYWARETSVVRQCARACRGLRHIYEIFTALRTISARTGLRHWYRPAALDPPRALALHARPLQNHARSLIQRSQIEEETLLVDPCKHEFGRQRFVLATGRRAGPLPATLRIRPTKLPRRSKRERDQNQYRASEWVCKTFQQPFNETSRPRWRRGGPACVAREAASACKSRVADSERQQCTMPVMRWGGGGGGWFFQERALQQPTGA